MKWLGHRLPRFSVSVPYAWNWLQISFDQMVGILFGITSFTQIGVNGVTMSGVTGGSEQVIEQDRRHCHQEQLIADKCALQSSCMIKQSLSVNSRLVAQVFVIYCRILLHRIKCMSYLYLIEFAQR